MSKYNVAFLFKSGTQMSINEQLPDGSLGFKEYDAASTTEAAEAAYAEKKADLANPFIKGDYVVNAFVSLSSGIDSELIAFNDFAGADARATDDEDDDDDYFDDEIDSQEPVSRDPVRGQFNTPTPSTPQAPPKMKLYGMREDNTLFIVAAENFSDFFDLQLRLAPKAEVEVRMAKVEFIMQKRFHRLTTPPFAVEIEGDVEKVMEELNFKDVGEFGLADEQAKMMKRKAADEDGNKTVAEKYKLNVPEGVLDGKIPDPVGAGARENVIAADGSFTEKHYNEGQKLLANEINVSDDGSSISAIFSMMGGEEDIADNDRELIDPSRTVNSFFKIEIFDSTIEEVEKFVSLKKIPFAYKDNDSGCWIAYLVERFAKDASEVLEQNGIFSVTYRCDNYGDPETKPEAPEPEPRPWNARSLEIVLFTEDEAKAYKSSFKNSEYYYSVTEVGGGKKVYVHITPVSYFTENKKMWDGEMPLNVDHIFAGRSFTTIGNGVYEFTRSNKETMETVCTMAKLSKSMIFDAFVIDTFLYGSEG